MIPKYCNPHALNQPMQPASRIELYPAAIETDQDDELKADEVAALATTLDRLVRSRIDVPGLLDVVSEPPKKKRRKNEHSQDLDQEAEESVSVDSLPFRLVSSVLPPSTVCLQPKPAIEVQRPELDIEDNEAAALLRSSRSGRVAVNVNWVLAQSQKPVYTRPTRHRVIEAQTSHMPSPPPALCLIENPFLGLHGHGDSNTEARHRRSLSRLGQSLLTSIVPLKEPSEKPRKKRRRRTVTSARPAPAFWRPDPELRGKCQGYAWGYPGSFAPRFEGDDSRRTWYSRDTMKRAVHADK